MNREEFESTANVSRETGAAFDIWRKHLLKWSTHTNLVGRATLDDFWHRHAWDSYQLVDHLPEGTRKIIDLGSGAGFPGIALALSFRERGLDGHVSMVDSVKKKVDFLNEVIDLTGAPADAKPVRAESMDPSTQVDLVTARAFAPLNKLLGYAEPLLKNGAQGLFLKGRRYEEELTQARKHWTFEVEVIPSHTSDGVILNMSEVQRVR